ncbi:hypothetical protein PG991_012938 [Apiospora marii]|uniref:Uncharacterized protein n=1 Tax=Apiospora marii TaxID=335849 RepID=A0ABR1RC51_9PEZI
MAPSTDPASPAQPQNQTPIPKQPNDRNDSFRSQGKRLTWRDSFKVIGRGRLTPSLELKAAQAKRDAQTSKRYAQIVSVYDDLPWEKLRDEFLLKRWPDEDFSQKPSRMKDHWQFETPEELTEVISSLPRVGDWGDSGVYLC